ncbi:hypothetical protein GCM10009754_76450 [Amycolatopsis minnesotensis]|uniref:Uncharacterized protein n=1 Tax=Amycolatopsis minnesotensis TaxID=337894 RepID=A0ABP5DXK4_9PSEU
MFGIVLAMVNESFTVPVPIAHTSMTFQRNPVIRLASDAIAIVALDLASDGAAGASGAGAGVAGGGTLGNIRVARLS